MVFATLQVYLLCFFGIGINVGDNVVDRTEIDALYKDVSTLSIALDPRDYVVPRAADQSNKYSHFGKNMMMIAEITIFYYKHMLTAPVSLSLAYSRALDYQVTFTIYAETATLTINGKVNNSVNYVRKDGKMMRFYACFLGKLCPMNNVTLPHPMNKFKIEADDSHTLLQIFIKSLMDNGLQKLSLAGDQKRKVYITTTHVCDIWFGSSQVLRIYESLPDHDFVTKLESPQHVQIKIFSLRFGYIIALIDISGKEDPEYRVFMVDRHVTKFEVYAVDPNIADEYGDDDYVYNEYDLKALTYRCEQIKL